MRKTNAAIAALALAAVATFPQAALSMLATVALMGSVAVAGAWLADRFGDLPGGDGRCA